VRRIVKIPTAVKKAFLFKTIRKKEKPRKRGFSVTSTAGDQLPS
jgi:hypothetical protein